jgi:ribosomal protein S18 acetylase RimI-like enzyme
MKIRALTAEEFDALLTCFNESFSDYAVPFVQDETRLRDIMARRGVRFENSLAAFDGERMIGFALNGVDGNRGYDSATGVVPSHRRTGAGRALMAASIELLKDRGVEKYQLEVLEENVKAETLYRSLGFEEARRFQCWTFEAQERTHARELANADLAQIRSWCDVAPSWQNDTPSIRRARDPHVVLGDERGAVIFFPRSGDVAQLAVDPTSRCNGLGRTLLNAAATRAAKALRIINVDDRDAGIAAFLERVGAKRMVRQIEMIRAL